jgi:ABC-type branched-subunit amino acid transport system substrate-binding protein
MPAVQVLSPLLPVSEYGPQARRLHARLATAPAPAIGSEALYGYEAMRVVLDAVTAVAPHAGDRTAVARAALTAGSRRSAIGDYRVLPSGETSTARFGAYRRSATELRYLGQRMATR